MLSLGGRQGGTGGPDFPDLHQRKERQRQDQQGWGLPSCRAGGRSGLAMLLILCAKPGALCVKVRRRAGGTGPAGKEPAGGSPL